MYITINIQSVKEHKNYFEFTGVHNDWSRLDSEPEVLKFQVDMTDTKGQAQLNNLINFNKKTSGTLRDRVLDLVGCDGGFNEIWRV